MFQITTIQWKTLKGGGHGKIYSEFIVQIFSLGGIKTHDTIFKFLEFVKMVK